MNFYFRGAKLNYYGVRFNFYRMSLNFGGVGFQANKAVRAVWGG